MLATSSPVHSSPLYPLLAIVLTPKGEGEHTPHTSSQNTRFLPLCSTLLQTTHHAVYPANQNMPPKDTKIPPAHKKYPLIQMLTSSFPLPISPIRSYLAVEISGVNSNHIYFFRMFYLFVSVRTRACFSVAV